MRWALGVNTLIFEKDPTPRSRSRPSLPRNARLVSAKISGVSHMTRQWKRDKKVDTGQLGTFV